MATEPSKKNETDPSESKIVNLYEDMNPHSHNEASYDKMKVLQDLSEGAPVNND